MDNSLLSYVKDELLRGVKKEDLRKVLIESGWNEGSVDLALSRFDDGGLKTIDKPVETNQKDEEEHSKEMEESDEKAEELIVSPEPSPSVTETSSYIPTPETPTAPGVTISETSKSTSGENIQPSEDLYHTIINNPTEQDQEKPKKPKIKIFLFILIAVLLLLLVGGGGYAAYNYVYLSPERVVGNMLQTMDSVNTFSYSGVIEVDNTSMSKNDSFELTDIASSLSTYYKADFSGAVDATSPDTQLVQVIADISTENFDIGKFEIITEGDTIFVKIHDFGFLEIVGFDIFKGEWIMVGQDDLSGYGITQSDDNGLLSGNNMKIEELLTNYSIIELGEKLPSENVNGEDTYHYSYVVNKEALVNYTVDLIKEYNSNVSEDDIQVFKEAVEMIEVFPGEVWISKDDYYLVQITFGIEYLNTETQDLFKTSGLINFKDYNQPNLVQAPTEYKSLEEFMGTLEEYMEFPSIPETSLDGSEDLEGFVDVEDLDSVPQDLLPNQDYLLPN